MGDEYDLGGYVPFTVDAEGNRINPDGTPYEGGDDGWGDSDDDDDDDRAGYITDLSSVVTYTDGTNARGEYVAIPSASHFPDGSRTWRFVPAADPSKWSDLSAIDQDLQTWATLGWIEANDEGNFWTVDEAAQAYEVYITAATAAYRAVDIDYDNTSAGIDALYGADAQQQPAPEAPAPQAPAQDIVPAPPPPPPDAPNAPAAPEWNRPADANAGGTNYGNVMDELRQLNPENDGRWTATQAADMYGDTEFSDEQGLTAASSRADAARQNTYGPDGAATPESFNAMNDADADLSRTQAQADSTRNRYQQTTDYQPPVPLDERLSSIDQSVQAARDQVANDPQSLGIGMTTAQQEAYVEAQEFTHRTGEAIDPAIGVTDAQRARLVQLREDEQAQYERDFAAWQATPEGQAATAREQRLNEQTIGEQGRVDASRQGAEERMGRNG